MATDNCHSFKDTTFLLPILLVLVGYTTCAIGFYNCDGFMVFLGGGVLTIAVWTWAVLDAKKKALHAKHG
tara:strand:+ start:4750 stop:4959 length:210 start_codon:yes stop_codon:yes gene_type:complete